MSQSVIKTEYSFSVDLDITESQLSSVKTAIITEGVPEETITFDSDNETVSADYYDTFYVYGDGILLYVGDILFSDHINNGGLISSANRWRAKYSNTQFLSYEVEWDNRGNVGFQNKMQWLSYPYQQLGASYYLEAPSKTTTITPPPAPLYDLPYNTITVKRNTGETLENVENLSVTSVPSGYTFPNLTKAVTSSNSDINQSKIWIKLATGKYRLKIDGAFLKNVNNSIITSTSYPIATYTYTPTLVDTSSPLLDSWKSFYSFSTSEESTGTLESVQPDYNPNNIKLLVSYVNNKGHNEIRHYTP